MSEFRSLKPWNLSLSPSAGSALTTVLFGVIVVAALYFGREVMVYSPEGRKIDAPFSGGETIRLSPDWEIEVWHVPGHSEGHLAIYDRKNRAAFTSDAVQSNGYPTVNGGVAFGPTYYEVNAYLNTVQLLESKPIDHMFGGHWPGMTYRPGWW